MPFAAYPGSTIQQNHGESIAGHGFLLWDFGNQTVEAFDVPNDHTMHTVAVGPGTDYDSLDIILKPSKFTHIKVNWTDYVSQLTRDNKAKIARHLRDRYQPVELGFRQNAVKLDERGELVHINAVPLDNITTEASQKKIFQEFLEANKYAPEDIVAIQAIHAIINERLRLTQDADEGQVYEYKIDSLWMENFKSYGERVDIDWGRKDGLWQITGENTAGKSTILDAITYLLYGTILGFQGSEREKLGDNRFINNIRDLDHCEVGSYLRLNEVRYKLVRRTVRVWQKSKGVRNIKSVTTSLNFYEVTGINHFGEELLKDVGIDRKIETNKLVQTYFGTMADFMRSSLINADTLTGLLSINHAVFVDSLLRDIGLDVFERMLKEFKVWRDETYGRASRLQINPAEEEARMETLKAEIGGHELEIINIETQLGVLDSRIAKGADYISGTLYPKLQTLRPELANTDPEALRREIHLHLQRIEALRDEMRDEKANIEAMVTSYSSEGYEDLLKKKEAHQKLISDLRAKLRTEEIAKTEAQHQVALIQGRMNMRQRDIAQLAEWQKGEEARLAKAIAQVRREIEHLETSMVCPTCKREKNAEVLDAIQVEIDSRLGEITEYEAEALTLPTQRVQKEQQILAATALIEEEKQPFLTQMETHEFALIKTKQAIDTHMLMAVEVGEEIHAMLAQKAIWDRKTRREADWKLLPMKIENLELQGQAKSRLLEEVEAAQMVLEVNRAVQVQIDKANDKLTELRQEKKGFTDQLAVLEKGYIPQKKRQIHTIETSLVAYQEQEHRDFILKAYEKCIHRDGIPTMLLKQYLGVINVQLNNLLDGMKFTLFLNEDLQFKMYNHNREDAIMNVMAGSGMQKTFTSLALRLALRQVNNKFRGNLLLMDEILGRLDANYLAKFSDLLTRAKEDIDKLVLIEHGNGDSLNPDYQIHVTSDKQGVSSLEILG
jgi:DNA repair exonuclease SbcCD ATPase subunit